MKGATKIETFYFPMVVLPDDDTFLHCYRGGYWGDTNAYGIDLSISRKACQINSVRYNGSEQSFTLLVYYK